jgi:hypothetical protein
MESNLESAAPSKTGAAAGSPMKTQPCVAEIRGAIVHKLTYAIGKRVATARPRDWFVATALTVRDRIVERWIATNDEIQRSRRKRVYYLSLEFLIGRLLIDALTNMQMIDETREALAGLGVDLEELRELEPDAALGNGGLGRLAACFMESMATLSIAAHGYGIRYDHGLFRQRIKDGFISNIPKTGCRSGTRGSSRGPNSNMTSVLEGGSRPGTRKTARSGTSGILPKRSRPWPMTRQSPAGAGPMSILSGFGRRARLTRFSSTCSTAATMLAH